MMCEGAQQSNELFLACACVLLPRQKVFDIVGALQAQVVVVCASSLCAALLMLTLLSSSGESPGGAVLLQHKQSTAQHSALEAEISKLRSKLDTADKKSPPAAAALHKRMALAHRGRHGQVAPQSWRPILAYGSQPRPIKRQALGASADADPSKPLEPYTAVARENAAWHRHNTQLDWGASEQAAYDKAVTHAQIAEKGTHESYEPLRVEQGYLHSSAKDMEAFETQLVDMVKLLEPSFLGETLQWAESGSSQENSVLEPFVGALEKPLIKDLDMEARVRVEHSVDALAQKHKLTLPEKEQLRAHLMAPLMMRIRARVHSQVEHYVSQMAREVVLKAANSSTPAGQAYVAAMNGAARASGVGLPNIPSLTEEDLSFTNAMHDLDTVYKNGVIDHYDYETQKAKLLSDWLKHSVNKAGGNADEVLRIVFGGDVKGVTDVGVAKKKSEIDVNKKLEMEKGVLAMGETRREKMTKDLVWQLVHGKQQWGYITGCTDKWETSECRSKWHDIKEEIESNFERVHEEDSTAHWGETYDHPKEQPLSSGSRALYKHLSGDARERIWEDKHGKVRSHTHTLLPSPASCFVRVASGLCSRGCKALRVIARAPSVKPRAARVVTLSISCATRWVVLFGLVTGWQHIQHGSRYTARITLQKRTAP